jgi:hypothetical protein
MTPLSTVRQMARAQCKTSRSRRFKNSRPTTVQRAQTAVKASKSCCFPLSKTHFQENLKIDAASKNRLLPFLAGMERKGQDCRIPTLEQWLIQVLQGNKIPLIELKGKKKNKHGVEIMYAGLSRAVLEVTRALGVTEKCIFQSFCHEYLFELRSMDRTVSLHTLYHFPQVMTHITPT